MEEKDDILEESLEQKIGKMNWLALSMEDIINRIGQCNLSNVDLDEWCVVADGLTEDWVMKHIEGRCSLKETLKYSIEDIEKIVDAKIVFLEDFNRRLNLMEKSK